MGEGEVLNEAVEVTCGTISLPYKIQAHFQQKIALLAKSFGVNPKPHALALHVSAPPKPFDS